jgi:KEOPS complex subunit Cgi121
LLKFIKEFGTYVEITGFNNVKVRNPQTFLRTIGEHKPHDADVQFFDADRIATWEHLYFAVLNALTVFANHENIAKSLAMETLLFAAAEKQIVKATALVGIKSDSQHIAIVIIAKRSGILKTTLTFVSKSIEGKPNDSVLELSENKVALVEKTFGIKRIELETVMEDKDLKKALVDLVVERMALSTTKR